MKFWIPLITVPISSIKTIAMIGIFFLVFVWCINGCSSGGNGFGTVSTITVTEESFSITDVTIQNNSIHDTKSGIGVSAAIAFGSDSYARNKESTPFGLILT